jgi:hypothetical protein
VVGLLCLYGFGLYSLLVCVRVPAFLATLCSVGCVTRFLFLRPTLHMHVDLGYSMTKAAQQALRRTMELYSSSTRFALACNNSTKIIEPIQVCLPLCWLPGSVFWAPLWLLTLGAGVPPPPPLPRTHRVDAPF